MSSNDERNYCENLIKKLLESTSLSISSENTPSLSSSSISSTTTTTAATSQHHTPSLLKLSSSSSSSRINDFLIATLPTIKCRPCSSTTVAEAGARAFIQRTSSSNNDRNKEGLEIILCSNRLKKNEIEEALLHELVHYYDYYNNSQTDFSSCEGLAYSEVRAAREAECKGYYLYPFENWAKKKCVSYYASRSTCNMFPKNGSSCVDKVIDKAMKDLSPEIIF